MEYRPFWKEYLPTFDRMHAYPEFDDAQNGDIVGVVLKAQKFNNNKLSAFDTHYLLKEMSNPENPGMIVKSLGEMTGKLIKKDYLLYVKCTHLKEQVPLKDTLN
jgi:hypothetical protein